MPTYEYRCPECGTNFDKFQRMSEEPGAECTKCGAQAQRRMSGGAGLLFKGSGFYITDYRGESYKKAAKSDSGGSDSGAASNGTGSDSSSGSKSESKADSKPSPSSSPVKSE